ncbi:MAG TPA: AAA family ATPase [Longimicrobium sp.]|nr:AAA family ATPase [Longimicrobium sp.]
MRTLLSLDLQGFKSIRALNLEFGDVNVLIGANGAGKSNLLSFLKLLKWMVTPPGELRFNIARLGGANAILHYGASVTRGVAAGIQVQDDEWPLSYSFALSYAVDDSLVFASERLALSLEDTNGFSGGGHRESVIIRESFLSPKAKHIADALRGIGSYHFHNTSDTARVRQRWSTEDSHQLKEDGGNLAPVLLRLSREHPAHYFRITETLRQVIPHFADFVLAPSENGTLLLQWRERDSDLHFGPSQASDGMLRLMALVALLLQPAENLPPVLTIDEPELGLHPTAIHLVAGLVQNVAQHTQVIVATQSPALLDHFDPEQIVVVDRPERESIFRRLDSEQLAGWLDEYTMAELWEKNVLGGKPA